MLRFRTKDQEPQTRVVVTPTLARERELAELGESKAPDERIRYATWNSDEIPDYLVGSYKLPTWAIVTGFLLGCVGIGSAIHLGYWLQSAGASESIRYVEAGQLAALMCLLVLLRLGLFLHSWWHRRKLARDLHLDALVDGPVVQRLWLHGEPLHGEITVSMALWQNGVAYGEDVGYLRYDGGALSFEGLRTSFSISKPRLRRVPVRVNLWTDLVGEYGFQATRIFSYQIDGKEYLLRFHPLGLEGAENTDREISKLDEWMQKSREASHIEVLPPRCVTKEAGARALRDLALPLLAMQLAMIVSISFGTLTSHLAINGFGFAEWSKEAFFALAGAGFGIASLVGLIRGIRAYRFLKRMNIETGG